MASPITETNQHCDPEKDNWPLHWGPCNFGIAVLVYFKQRTCQGVALLLRFLNPADIW
jgi:hypothetical protein